MTRGRLFDVGVKFDVFHVSPENDHASPNVKTPFICTNAMRVQGHNSRSRYGVLTLHDWWPLPLTCQSRIVPSQAKNTCKAAKTDMNSLLCWFKSATHPVEAGSRMSGSAEDTSRVQRSHMTSRVRRSHMTSRVQRSHMMSRVRRSHMMSRVRRSHMTPWVRRSHMTSRVQHSHMTSWVRRSHVAKRMRTVFCIPVI